MSRRQQASASDRPLSAAARDFSAPLHEAASFAPRDDGGDYEPPTLDGRRVGKTVAVTGGAGFIGSRLCELLVRQGHQVVCIDNFQTGAVSNIAGLLGAPSFSLIIHDIRYPLPHDLPRLDEIYNLACAASPPQYQVDRVGTALVCAQGALHVLQRALRDGARVLQASTSEVYGDPEVHPQTETYRGCVNPVGPRACYDEGKRFAETLFTDFARQTGLTVKIARIFNTYGPRMQVDDGRVVSNFVVQALRGEDLTVYGDGSQTRSFCYVDDLVDGLIRLMASPSDFSQPVNLGNPSECNVLELAQLVARMTGAGLRIAYQPLPEDDPRRRRPDITLASERLGWRPSTPLGEGLEKTIAYFAAQLGESGRAASPCPAVVEGELHESASVRPSVA